MKANALGHIGFGALLIVAFFLAGYLLSGAARASLLCAWAMQCAYWLGRERRDHEIKVGLNPVTDWWKGWDFPEWSLDGRRDLLFPTLVNGAWVFAVVALI